MKNKLNIKLITSYLLLSLILIFSLAIIINITFEAQFKKYIINIQQEKNLKIVDNIEDVITQSLGKDQLEIIGLNALEDGLIVKVIADNNKVLWDAMEHNSGMCVEMLEKMAVKMKEYYPNFKGDHTEEEYLIKDNEIIIGKVIIGYYGPYYFNDNDIAFLKTFNQMITIVVILSVFLSLVFGIIMANKITSKITKVVKVTKKIANGNYNLKIKNNTNILEISDLITSINFLAKSLSKQTNLRKQMTIDIAHELRTPIAVLKSHLEALKDKVWEIDDKRINSLYDEVNRLNKIINNIDKLNDYDNNQVLLNKTSFNIRELINSVVMNFDKQLHDKQIKLDIDGKDINITADKDQITSVLVNLLSNAIKYTDNEGNIKILLKSNKTNVVIEVIDNGIGISKKHLPYIFERFYRVDNSRTRSTGGMGIGLSIVKTIIDNHEGTITVKSKLNKGTHITIIIPNQ